MSNRFDVRSNKMMMITMLFLSHLIFPCAALVLLTFFRMPFIIWVTFAILTSSGILLLFIAGYWGTFYWHVRTFLILFLIIVIAFKMPSLDFSIFKFDVTIATIGSLLVGMPFSFLFIIQTVKAISARNYSVSPVNISFPFKNGRFVISDGGNGGISKLINYHFSHSGHSKRGTNKAMAYAVDIVEMSAWGAAAWNLFPNQNEKYPIYGKEIISPCDGTVVAVENAILDNIPFGPRPYNIGNYVVIKNDDFQVLLGHLKQLSIKVKTGDVVKKGQALASAGNSGWTERPHLHMQAMKLGKSEFWENEGVPFFFDGKNPVKNTRFYCG